MKKQELSPVLCTLPHVNAFCNKKVIRKNTDCLTLIYAIHIAYKKVCELYQKVTWVSHTVKSPYKKGSNFFPLRVYRKNSKNWDT